MDLYRVVYYIQHIDELSIAPLAAAIIFVAAVVILVFIIRVTVLRAHPKKYLQTFEPEYNESGDVLTALEKSKQAYRKRSKEAEAINDAILHLTTRSILRDYSTAFKIVEFTITGKKVKAMHERVLNAETQKKLMVLGIGSGITRDEEHNS